MLLFQIVFDILSVETVSASRGTAGPISTTALHHVGIILVDKNKQPQLAQTG